MIDGDPAHHTDGQDFFCENNESMSGYFHAWVASKSLLMDVLFYIDLKIPSITYLTQQINSILLTNEE